jgi:hypothetical protein
VAADPFIEGIHSIGAKGESYIPCILADVFVVLIEVFPLATIDRVTPKISYFGLCMKNTK